VRECEKADRLGQLALQDASHQAKVEKLLENDAEASSVVSKKETDGHVANDESIAKLERMRESRCNVLVSEDETPSMPAEDLGL
jgi:hypothetical protein